MPLRTNKTKNNRPLTEVKSASELLLYPVDMSRFLSLAQITVDATGIPSNGNPAGHHPTAIARVALAHWNQYQATHDDIHREAFLKQAFWLLEHEAHISDDAGGWPISSPHPDVPTSGPWLSALTQGIAISVLLRAYQLTHQEAFFEVACRAVRTFERDILDGGVTVPIDNEGIFFEEVAVYPAAHMLTGFIFGLLGLLDYLALTDDARIREVVQRSHATMHGLFDEFDGGFWTYTHLLRRSLASPAHLALQVALLEALAGYSDCDRCTAFVLRWKGYQRRLSCRLRYLIGSHHASYSHVLWDRIRTLVFPRFDASDSLGVCVPVTAFPVTGGIRTVLAGVAQVTKDIWQTEYLTKSVGPNPNGFVIHRFGTARMFPSHFPNVWLYCLTGFCKLISLMRKGAGYRVILPQDGVFTAAYAGLAGKLAGVRVVSIDHGNLTLINSRAYRIERIEALQTTNWSRARRLLARLRDACYWPSLRLLAPIAVRFVDHFLIPGVEGDGVEENCTHFGIRPSRVTRFASVIDMDRHALVDADSRSSIREEKGIAAEAIIISMVCRLAPEKGLEIAMEGISQALSVLPLTLREAVRVIIAGDGPLRKYIEEDIRRRGLSQNCALWGEVTPEDALSLLGISDIFLYTSTRGACFSMSVLEAMASGCAVIASTEPMSNKHLLAEGRGIAVPPGDAEQTGAALVRLVNDPECRRQMGCLARGYVALHHSAALFRRTLMRATYWSELDSL
nr:D-glucuronyl C5-epimerase family protein [Ktedonobacteraceae bacterium]